MPILKAQKREIIGKKVKSLRKQGKIPAVVYGAGDKGALLQIEARDFEKVFREAGESSLVELHIVERSRRKVGTPTSESENTESASVKNVLIHAIALDPIKDTPVHVDFLAVRMDKPIRVKVPLIFEGESPAVKNLGGVLVKVRHELEVEALPKELPHEIKVDLGQLQKLEDKIMVSDLKLPPGAKVFAAKDEVLALAETPRVEEEVSAEVAPSLDSIEVIGKKKEKTEEGAEAPAEEPKESKKPARPAGGEGKK